MVVCVWVSVYLYEKLHIGKVLEPSLFLSHSTYFFILFLFWEEVLYGRPHHIYLVLIKTFVFF